MRSYDDLMRENETLRRRVSLLRAASLRSGAGPELGTVLREAVESARALTGARYGAVITLDRRGQPRDFVSSGLSDEEHRRLMDWPDGPRLFVHTLPGILAGQEDVPARLRPNGFSADLLTFQDTPIRHQGVHLGNLFLVEKEGGEKFTSEDDEMMALFASQVAGAIADARTYRAEHLARTDPEAPAPLQEMQRMPVDFLDLVSRALRAPLTSIKGSTATVLCASPAPAAAEMLQFFRIVNEQADHMSDLLTGLLDAARIDAGMLTFTPEPSDAGALVEQAHRAFTLPMAEEAGAAADPARSQAESGPFTLGELTINYDRRSAALAGRPLKLTATEYELLRVLSLNAGKVSTYDTLLRRVWGRRDRGDLKLLRAYVGKLRRKLGDDANRPTYIITERRLGYRMNRPGQR